MIDIHSHILPGIDDGAETMADAVAMCRTAAQDGCTAIIATPHMLHPQWPEQDISAFSRLRAELQSKVGLGIRVLGGAEVRVNSKFLSVLDQLDRECADLRLAGSSYLLMEFDPHGMGPDPRASVHEAQQAGWRPVIAHPEVYSWLAKDLELLEALIERGALLQITAASVTGNYGRAPRSAARRLLDANLVHFVASDGHNMTTRPPGLSEARQQIEKRYGAERATRLFEDHPKALLENRRLGVAA